MKSGEEAEKTYRWRKLSQRRQKKPAKLTGPTTTLLSQHPKQPPTKHEKLERERRGERKERR